MGDGQWRGSLPAATSHGRGQGRGVGEDCAARAAWAGVYYRDQPPISEWIGSNGAPKVVIHIPTDGAPRVLEDQAMFDRETVFFGKDKRAARVVCASREQALLVKRLAELELRGVRSIPDRELACSKLLDELNLRVEAAKIEFETLASNRVSEPKTRIEIVTLMLQWFVHGKPSPGRPVEPEPAQLDQPDAEI